jgi:hypothetical protein
MVGQLRVLGEKIVGLRPIAALQLLRVFFENPQDLRRRFRGTGRRRFGLHSCPFQQALIRLNALVTPGIERWVPDGKAVSGE